jgi:hypothetical protein
VNTYVLVALLSFFCLTVFTFWVNVRASGKRARVKYQSAVANHRMWVNRFLIAVLAEVVAVELIVISQSNDMFGFGLLDSILGKVHLAFDIIFLISVIVLRFWIKGTVNSMIHVVLAKWVAFSSLVGLHITGIWLMTEMLSR